MQPIGMFPTTNFQVPTHRLITTELDDNGLVRDVAKCEEGTADACDVGPKREQRRK
jgi:hypothetical protein